MKEAEELGYIWTPSAIQSYLDTIAIEYLTFNNDMTILAHSMFRAPLDKWDFLKKFGREPTILDQLHHSSKVWINDDITMQSKYFEKSEFSAWATLYDSFIQFYEDISFWDKTWFATVESGKRWADLLNGWRKRYKDKVGHEPSGQGIAPPTDEQLRDKYIDLAKMAIIILGIGATGYLVSKLRG